MFLCAVGHADYRPYSGVQTIETSAEGWRVIHHHDWTQPPEIGKSPESIFSGVNRAAYVELWEPSAETPTWRAPSPALSDLWVSPDREFIVGLSRIKANNPYQLVIFSAKGAVLMAEHVATTCARFNREDIQSFWREYPHLEKPLENHTREDGGNWYIDFTALDREHLGNDALKTLQGRRMLNLFYPGASESTHNWIYWYANEPEPEIIMDRGRRFLTLQGYADEGKGEPPRLKIAILSTPQRFTGPRRSPRE